MRLSPLRLETRLSRVSWFSIELFAAVSIFFLPFSKSAAEISAFVALIIWLLRKFPWDEPFPHPRLFKWSYFALLALTLASSVMVPPELRLTALRGSFKALKYICLFFMCAELFADAKTARRLAGVFLLSVACAAANGYWQMFTGVDLFKGHVADVPGRFVRMKGAFSAPNGLAAFLLMGLPVIFERWWRRARWDAAAAAWVFCLIACGVAFIATLSRGAFIGLGAAVLGYALVRRDRKVWVVIVAAAVPLLLSGVLRENFLSSMHGGNQTVLERFRFWSTALSMVQHHPVLGIGANLFTARFGEFAPAAEVYRGYAHNSYLQMTAEIGAAGLAAFLIPVGVVFWKYSRRATAFGPREALAVGLVAFLVQAFFDTHFYSMQTAHLFWMAWGTFNALPRRPALPSVGPKVV